MTRASIPVLGLASALLLTLAGCSAGGNGGTACPGTGGCGPILGPTPAVNIYVVENVQNGTTGQPQILQFLSTDSGSATPASTITLPVGLTLGALATDPTGNIYVATSTDIREFAAGSTGAATPLRVLPANATTTIGNVTGLAVDNSGNLYVAEQNAGIAVFSSSANGSVAPTRYILGDSQTGGGLSTLVEPGALTVDLSGNLYVSNQDANANGSIVVFGPTASANVAPARVIAGALTTLRGGPHGIAVGANGNLYVADNFLASVLTFAAGANGNVAPTQTLYGNSTMLGVLFGLSLDNAGYLHVVTDGDPFTNVIPADPTILSFPASASGDTAPTAYFTSQQWNVSGAPLDIAAN